MDTRKQELEDVIADLRLIKEAVSKGDNFFRFIDTRRAMRGVMLATGLMIAFFSGLYYYLTSIYGSFMAMPLNLRIVFYVLVGIGWIVLGFIKAGGF
jgi:hypothetical protein